MTLRHFLAGVTSALLLSLPMTHNAAAATARYVKSVSVSATHSCALISDGTLRCWGENQWGELGNQSRDNSATPVPVIGERNIVAVRAGEGFTCALHSSVDDGRIDCWGLNTKGQLGRGSISLFALYPAPVAGLSEKTTLYGSDSLTCANGSCWGRFEYPIARTATLGGHTGFAEDTVILFSSAAPASFASIGTAFGTGHVCSISGGHTNCYGDFRDGQYGNSAGGSSASGISSATAIAAGGRNTCVLLKNTRVKCWGANMYSPIWPFSVPLEVQGLSDVVSIAMAGDTISVHACAITTDARVWCWPNGNNLEGPIAAPLPGLSGVLRLYLGRSHSCALLKDESVWCWGDGAYGQLGNGSEMNSATPVRVNLP